MPRNRSEKVPPPTVDRNGVKRWRNIRGELHREDGPAIEWPEGDGGWYHNGLLHRKDGPAIEFVSGHREWWLNGLRQPDAP